MLFAGQRYMGLSYDLDRLTLKLLRQLHVSLVCGQLSH